MADHCLETKAVNNEKGVMVGILVCIAPPHGKKEQHTWSKEYKVGGKNREKVTE